MKTVEIEHLIPHRGAMIFLDRVVKTDSNKIFCEFEIKPDFFLCEQGKVPAYVGVEIIAQSIAAFNGVKNYSDRYEPEIGFLLGVRKFRSQVPYFNVGDILNIETTVEYIEESLCRFVGEISIGERKVIEALLSTFKPTPQQLLELKEMTYDEQ